MSLNAIYMKNPAIPKKVPINANADGATSVYALDLDGDGDIDVLSAGQNGSEKVTWFENNGSQSFTENTITTNYSSPYDVYAVDMDKDGNIDRKCQICKNG
mgnify:CR=1 FL=1